MSGRSQGPHLEPGRSFRSMLWWDTFDDWANRETSCRASRRGLQARRCLGRRRRGLMSGTISTTTGSPSGRMATPSLRTSATRSTLGRRPYTLRRMLRATARSVAACGSTAKEEVVSRPGSGGRAPYKDKVAGPTHRRKASYVVNSVRCYRRSKLGRMSRQCPQKVAIPSSTGVTSSGAGGG